MLVLAWPVMYPLAGARSLKKATDSHEPFYPPERSSRFAKVSLDMSGDGLKDGAALVIDRARHHSGLRVCFAKKEPTLPPNCHILVDDDLEDSYDDMGLVVCPPRAATSTTQGGGRCVARNPVCNPTGRRKASTHRPA